MKVWKEYRGIVLSAAAVLLFLIGSFWLIARVEQKESVDTYAEHLFRENTVNEIEITIAEADWKNMLENPLAEEYHRADVTINGETKGNVAIRTKGNTSLTLVANSDSDRYSFKLDFDYYEDGGNYYGLKKLCLNNSYADNGGLREYIAYAIMREMGIPVPDCAYSHITVNGEEWGLYLVVEPIDEVFLKTRFADATGDLYKPEGRGGTGADLVYRGEEIDTYTGLNLKTNLETSDGSEILALMQALESGEGLEQVLNVEEALKYIAANVALANFDSYLGGTTHNYYLYEENGIFSVLPWDLNLAFGGFGGGTVDIYEPANNSMGGGRGGQGGRGNRAEPNAAAEQPAETAQIAETAQTAERKQPQTEQMQMPQGNPLTERTQLLQGEIPKESANTEEEKRGMSFDAGSDGKPLVDTLLADETLRSLYEGYLKELAETYLTEEYIGTMVTQIHALIAPYVEKDATAFYTYEEFEQVCSVDPADPYSLVYYAVNMAADIQNQLAGGEPSFDVSTLQGAGMGFGRGGEGGRAEMSDMPNMPNMGELPEIPEREEMSALEEMSTQENKSKIKQMEQQGEFPEGMSQPPEGMRQDRQRQKQLTPIEYVPQLAVCGGLFAAGGVFLFLYKRKKDL